MALAQAASYMRATHTSMTEYLELYNTAWDDLMNSGTGYETLLPEYGNRSIQTTWTVSFEGVKKKNEDAAKMLQVWSYLDNRDIWFEMFNNKINTDLRLWSNPPAWFRRVVHDKISFKGVAATLLAYSLIEARQDSESYGVHPVVHEWCRKSIKSDKQPELAFLAITSVAFGTPCDLGRNSWPTRRRLLQHANRFSQELMDMLEKALESEQAIELNDAFRRLGRLYLDEGSRMWVEADAMYCRAISGLEKLRGSHHRITLSTQVGLAKLYCEQERFVDAEALNRRVLAIRTEKLGLDHEDTLKSIFHLAAVLSRSNKLAEAENLYQSLLMRSQDLSFDEDFVFAALGHLYMQQGKLTESEAMYLQAIAGFKTYLETDHPDILRARHLLGCLYHREGRLVEAETAMHQALEGMKKSFGVNDDLTLKAMKSWGRILENQERLAEAETAFEQALAGHRLVSGPKHKITLDTLDALALCYVKQDKFIEAEPLLLQRLESLKQIPDDQKTSIQLECLLDLGYIYLKLGRPAEAEQFLRRALSGYRRVLGSKDKRTLDTVRLLRACYEDQGKLDEAAALSPEDTYMQRFHGHDPTTNI